MGLEESSRSDPTDPGVITTSVSYLLIQLVQARPRSRQWREALPITTPGAP